MTLLNAVLDAELLVGTTVGKLVAEAGGSCKGSTKLVVVFFGALVVCVGVQVVMNGVQFTELEADLER